jgi:hypothetical protein
MPSSGSSLSVTIAMPANIVPSSQGSLFNDDSSFTQGSSFALSSKFNQLSVFTEESPLKQISLFSQKSAPHQDSAFNLESAFIGESTFTLFPSLPKELRLLVWTYAIEANPQLIDLHYYKNVKYQWKTKHRPPKDVVSISLACAESLTLIKKRYIYWDSGLDRRLAIPDGMLSQYCPDMDAVLLRHSTEAVIQDFAARFPLQTQTLKVLVLDFHMTGFLELDDLTTEAQIVEVLRCFVALKELVIFRTVNQWVEPRRRYVMGGKACEWPRGQEMVAAICEREGAELRRLWPKWKMPLVRAMEYQRDLRNLSYSDVFPPRY